MLIYLAFLFVYFGGRGPYVNEVHYLAKARHFWDPQWCRGDPFLESANTHVGFCASLGWLTSLSSLRVSALILRLASWGWIAVAWRRLCHVLGMRELDAFLAFAVTVYLVTYQHLAGEWFVGGVEGKPFSYGFVLLALAYALQPRWSLAWICIGGAVFFHPVVGAWAGLGLGVLGLARPKPRSSDPPATANSDRGIMPAILAATVLVLIGIVPVMIMQWRTPAVDVARAEQIHVYERLPHHMVPHRMAPENQVRFAVLVTVWCGLAWWEHRNRAMRQLQRFVAYTLLLTIIGILIDSATFQRPDVGARWLKYYWFRMSDVFVPIGIALGAFVAVAQRSERAMSIFRIAILALLMVVMVDRFRMHRFDPRPPADRQGHFGLAGTLAEHVARHHDWKDLCAWVRQNTDPGARFLTPTHSQTFNWYAERAELVTWKDCPQDAAAILAWRDRLAEVDALALYRGDDRPTDDDWQRFASSHGVDYVIVLRERAPGALSLPHVFRNDTFDIYRDGKQMHNNLIRN